MRGRGSGGSEHFNSFNSMMNVKPAIRRFAAIFLSTRINREASGCARPSVGTAREKRVRTGSRKWLMGALVVCGLATACQDYNTNLSVQTSSSVLTFISPSQATVGSQGFTITANGSGFTTGAEIQWNGVPLVTTLVSSIQLTAPVPASNLASTGVVQISIRIQGSAQSPTQNIYSTTTSEVSNVVLFTVSAAPGTPPMLTSLSPNSAPFCGASFSQLMITGTGFTSDSMVNWNGSPRATVMNSATQLTASILASDTSAPSPVPVTVSNSSGTSNALQFTILSPTANLSTPQPISSLAPPSALAGSSATQMVVRGGAYLPCSLVKWTNSSGTTVLPTQYVSATQLNATIPASDLQTAGAAQVTVFTPAPGGGTTAPAAFTITQPPTPTITSVTVSGGTATSTPACSASNVTLQVTGTNFVNGSVVNWNGTPLSSTTTFVSATQLNALVPFADTVSAGTAAITVSNGSAVSNSLNFSVTTSSTLPAPAATAIAPSSAMAGSGQFTLNVTGTQFQPCSVIQWNGSPLTTRYLNPTQLTAPVPASDVASAASVPVTVFTPAPGGGTSNPAVDFTISALSIGAASVLGSSPPANSMPYCSASGFTLDVTAATGTTFTPDTVVNWNGSPRPTTFVSATELQAAITYADIAFPGSVSITVSNSASTSAAASFTLSVPTSLPTPTITSLSPSNAAAGGPAFTLSVIGSGMLPCSTVQWNTGNTAARTTTFTSPNGLTASISAADIASPTIDQVTVNTPPPSGCTPSSTVTCGGTSNASAFTVFTPVAGAVRPAAAIHQAGGTEVTAAPAPLLALHLMSADQRFAVHVLASLDGVTEVAGSTENIFVRDTCAGAPAGCVPSEKLVSVGAGGNPADGNSFSPSISADGRYVAFLSSARNLVDGDTNGVTDVFVRDTCSGVASNCTPTTQRVSVAGDGSQADGPSTSATISPDGRYITFESQANSLGAPSASPSTPGFFLRDTCAGTAAVCAPSTAALQ